ncbi:Hypothetical predicted protein [Octopus vulgaris]|uniref:Uncharacterized protein n=1 Tax=Octopus vulgaris TaxID=6645 RepID=A0AA36F950_OCTVU|nr:Hypothetical predicted protein [Octopus vulgaris]
MRSEACSKREVCKKVHAVYLRPKTVDVVYSSSLSTVVWAESCQAGKHLAVLSQPVFITDQCPLFSSFHICRASPHLQLSFSFVTLDVFTTLSSCGQQPPF